MLQAESQAQDGGNRQTWSNPTEFLMSCIATSVGLGNVWRFPYVAYHNGGGAFLIPYLIVLVLIGRPMYYLETFLGQFSSSNCVRIWALSPAMKGTCQRSRTKNHVFKINHTYTEHFCRNRLLPGIRSILRVVLLHVHYSSLSLLLGNELLVSTTLG